MSPQQPLPPVGLWFPLSFFLMFSGPPPNPFQHHFWFFSGDALPACPASLHTSKHPPGHLPEPCY